MPSPSPNTVASVMFAPLANTEFHFFFSSANLAPSSSNLFLGLVNIVGGNANADDDFVSTNENDVVKKNKYAQMPCAEEFEEAAKLFETEDGFVLIDQFRKFCFGINTRNRQNIKANQNNVGMKSEYTFQLMQFIVATCPLLGNMSS
ncbi:hypothetical protein ACHAXS_000866 [Conticribra weissflogii]